MTFWQDIDDREFLSTLSLRRATYNCTPHNRLSQFLSTLSLRRATRLGLLGWLRVLISIHALLAESDGISSIRIIGFLEFLSTLSLRRATNGHETSPYRAVISIHALLAESDPAKSESLTTYLISIHALLAESDLHYLIPNSGTLHFYPRSPCGERQGVDGSGKRSTSFLSTLSLRRATLAILAYLILSMLFLSTLSLRRATQLHQ